MLSRLALEEIGDYETEAELKHNIVSVVKVTSMRLGNGAPTCRKFYIHPGIFKAYEDGTLLAELGKTGQSRSRYELRREEKVVSSILRSYDASSEVPPLKKTA